MEFFKCYSINLLRFLRANGKRNLSKGVNPNTNRTYWVFILDDELKELLKIWTINKPKKGDM